MQSLWITNKKYKALLSFRERSENSVAHRKSERINKLAHVVLATICDMTWAALGNSCRRRRSQGNPC